MTMNNTTHSAPSVSVTIGLWAAQITLATMFGMAGYMHIFFTPHEMAQAGVLWPMDAPIALVRFIGGAELAGSVAIVLPAFMSFRGALTRAAAVGFAAIQTLAIPFHIVRGEASVVPFNLLLLALALFVVWGRKRSEPSTQLG